MISLRDVLAACMMCNFFAAPAAQSQPVAVLQADIAPQPLAQALLAFSRELGLQFAYEADIAVTLRSGGAGAGQSTLDALTQLLKGTGLTFEFINERTVRIYAAPLSPPPVPSPGPTGPEPRHDEFQRVTLEEVVVTARKREEPA